MVDPIGSIASVITIAQVVLEGIKYAKTVYDVQQEFNALQDRLEGFVDVVRDIDKEHGKSLLPSTARSLCTAHITIEQLNQIVQQKLLRNVNGTTRVRRRAWMRNRSKILRLQHVLSEQRAEILSSLGADTLFSAKRSEATLTALDHRAIQSNEATLNLHRHLSEIQQAILETHQMLLSQGTSPNCALHTDIAVPRDQLSPAEVQVPFPWQTSEALLATFQAPATSKSVPTTRSSKTAPGFTEERFRDSHNGKPSWELGVKTPPFYSLKQARSRPASPFETSPSFMPETYTMEQRLPDSFLTITNSYEQSFSNEFRTNFYRAFYQSSSRQWHRVHISMSIHRSSIYSAATQLSIRGYRTAGNSVGNSSLPRSLLKQILELLSHFHDLKDDARFWLSLQNQEIVQQLNPKSALRSPSAPTMRSAAFSKVIGFLEDLGCARHVEREITQVEMIDVPTVFLSCINGKMVYETRFSWSTPTYEQLYNIRILRSFHDVPGFKRLVGIVTDDSGKTLKSYLVEAPRFKPGSLWETVTRESSIPWERREKWARQLVDMVRHVHARGFVVGTLWNCQWHAIEIDQSDHLQFSKFKSKFQVGWHLSYFFPPEFERCRDISKSIDEANYPNITPKTDIFHLGMVLWHLAEGFPRPMVSPACFRAKCDLQQSSSCNESHLKAVTLPSLPETIPRYYREIVQACRAIGPGERPAAWKLLELFPPQLESGHSQSSIQISSDSILHTRLSPAIEHSFRRDIEASIICDYCCNVTGNSFFHCNLCREGDFDMCQACYESGRHCFNRDHLLVAMQPTTAQGFVVSGKYSAFIGDQGAREIIEL